MIANYSTLLNRSLFQIETVDSPAALHQSAEHPRKTAFSFLKEKIGRAQNPKCKDSFSGVQSRFIGTTAGLASFILGSLRNTFELRPICSANFRNSKLGKKESRRGAPSVLHSPHEIPNLKGCATPSVSPRLPIQNYD